MSRSGSKLEAVARIAFRQVPLSIAATLIIAGVLLNFGNVIARYLFQASIFWAEEALIYGMIWSIFLAAVAVTYDRADLTMDFFFSRVSVRAQFAIDAALSLISIATFLFIAWQSLSLNLLLARNGQRSLGLEVPMVVPQSSLLVGFVLLAIVVAVRFIFRSWEKRPPAVDDIAARS